MRETITEQELVVLYAMAMDLEALMSQMQSDNSLNTMMALLGYPAPKNARLFAQELRAQAREQFEAQTKFDNSLDKEWQFGYNDEDDSNT